MCVYVHVCVCGHVNYYSMQQSIADYCRPQNTSADYRILQPTTDTADNRRLLHTDMLPQTTTDCRRVLQTTADYFNLPQATSDYCRPRKTAADYYILTHTTTTADNLRLPQTAGEYCRLLRIFSACRRLPQTTADQGRLPKTTTY